MCTSIIAGKKATSDATILLARNEDFEENNWNKYLKYREKPQYAGIAPNKKWTLGNGLQVDVPSKSYRYCSIPDATGSKEASCCVGDFYYFEERGINECNVAISATNSMDMNNNARQADPPVPNRIEESIILTLLLPQVSTAREAVTLLGHYVEQYKASEANGVLIADLNEAWYFEIGSAKHWIAVKIPEDSYLVISNCMRIHDVDLDSQDVMHSKELFDFVVEHKLLENPLREKFDFAKAFGTSGSVIKDVYNPFYNTDRIWLAQKILSPSIEQEIRLDEYPMFLKPDKKITISDVIRVLRAGYKGTELEKEATRPIGVVRTAESHIITLDASMPDKLEGVIWQSISSPLGAPYMPIFAITDKIPECYQIGESSYTPTSAYWAFRSLFSLENLCGKSVLSDIWREYEEWFISEHQQIKKTLQKLYKKGPEIAINFAKNYSTGILRQINNIAWERQENTLTEIAKNQKDC